MASVPIAQYGMLKQWTVRGSLQEPSLGVGPFISLRQTNSVCSTSLQRSFRSNLKKQSFVQILKTLHSILVKRRGFTCSTKTKTSSDVTGEQRVTFAPLHEAAFRQSCMCACACAATHTSVKCSLVSPQPTRVLLRADFYFYSAHPLQTRNYATRPLSSF